MEPRSLLLVKARVQKKRMPLYRKLVRAFWIIVLGSLALAVLTIGVISLVAIPSFRELEDPKSALASEVLAENGAVLGRYFIENRVPVKYEQLNPQIVNALVATEDERFRDHCGVDYRAVARVMIRTLLLRDQSAGGGSTITQQLAKNLYSDRKFEGMSAVEKTFALAYRKLREWITAVKLERSYTKEEILAMYLNQVDFVNNAYGIQSASEVYFGKSQEKLKIEEAATLIGMLQNPSRYNPARFPDRCIQRRMVVLYQMRNNDYITDAQYDSLKILPLDMRRFKRVSFTDDKAPYLCAELKKDVQRILDAPEARKPDGTKYNIYREGLRIYTTINPVYQAHAEAAMREQMRTLQKRFFQVWKGRDPWSYRGRETTDEELAIRQGSLTTLMRDGDRYQTIRPKYMDEIGARTEEKYDIELRDADMVRMLGAERDKGSLSRLTGKKIITPEMAAAYRDLMKSPEWPVAKKQWSALQTAIRATYNKKVKMRVFSWDAPGFEKDTVMSPMDSLKYHRMFLQTGILAVDPMNSEIKAWVGGIHFKYFQFDHVRSRRQVGSTFKPFVYATAIAQQSISPCFQTYDVAVTIPAHYGNFNTLSDWTPSNSTGSYSGERMTLKDALKHSVNSFSAYLMKQMGDTRPVRGLVHNMGIDSSLIPDAPSICLGASDLMVYEMTGAYATFANNGLYGRPFVIRKITDKNGKVLYENIPEERRALPANANYVMTQMLRYNVAGAPGINTLKSDVGGKTGTTNEYSDGWFVGITPRLVVGTWVGGEDRWIRFLSLSDGQGSRMARPIFAGFLQRLEQDPKSGYNATPRFEPPPGDLGIETDCAAYENAGPASDEEYFGPDLYNDQVPPGNKQPQQKQKTPPIRRPDDAFGDDFGN